MESEMQIIKDENDINNCPFCNGKAYIIVCAVPETPVHFRDGKAYQIYCSECEIYQLGWREKEYAKKVWNKRYKDTNETNSI
jgi:hypothetical protein